MMMVLKTSLTQMMMEMVSSMNQTPIGMEMD